MTEKEYDRVTVERTENEEYEIHGYGRDMSKEPEKVIASYLSVNGIGFACSSAEFSQHKERITVEQETERGSANIKVQSST